MRSVPIAVGVAVLLASAATAQGRPFAFPLYSIGVEGAGLGFSEAETIVVSMVRMPATTLWFAERWRQESSWAARTSSTKHEWIDGRTCPGLIEALDQIADLPSVKLGSPRTFADTGSASDVSATSLRGPPAESGGSGVWVTRREYLGPLADWRLRSETALARCWKAEKVSIDGVDVPTRLGSEQEARSWRP